MPKIQSTIRWLAMLASAGLTAFLVWRAGPSLLWQDLTKLGWGFTLVVALAGIAHLLKTRAWQMTLGRDQDKISFPRLVGLRLGAEAAGQLGILGQTFGDSIRVSQLSREMQTASSLASVTLDRGFYLVTGIIVAIAGVLSALPALSASHALRLYAGLFVFAAIQFLLLTLLAVRKRCPFLSGSARLVGRIPSFESWVERRIETIRATEDALFDFHHKTPRAFWTSFSLNLVGQCLAILEVCLVLWLLGAHIGFLGALIIEGLTKLLNTIGNFNPGNIGTYEGGNMLIGKIFSLSSASGLALALARRLRAFFWTLVGGVCLVFLTRGRGNHDSRNLEKAATMTKDPGTTTNASDGFGPSRNVTFVIFVASRSVSPRFSPPLARVGTLPILLRTILAAQKIDSAETVVVVDPTTKQSVQANLGRTGRLPESVRWIEVDADASVDERLRLVVSQTESQRLVLVDGDTTYHPSLIRKATEWNEDAALALTSRDRATGIYALSVDVVRDFWGRCPGEIPTLGKLEESLAAIGSLSSMEVSDDLWQRVTTEEDRRIAERKLDRWLVKPTDGMYAQFNRRISIPISRQLIKFPITANMVSLFTLGVGFFSAVFFALGGYWNTLLGAFLCVFASILDGCDGEVARLKLLESDFGCWLETVCDYLFYFFLLVGMTVGQWRTSGSNAYLFWGALLLLGALASFLAVGWQRHRLAAGRPEQLLGIWHNHAESRPSNPLLYAARHMEFMVRRCFFPYALLAFALLNIMNVAFVLSVIGANLVWPVALYSSNMFAGARRAAVIAPMASE
jgi:phosphatidylglycerophosphate synthase